MEKWQTEHIKNHYDKLVHRTSVHVQLLAVLESKGVLGSADIEKIKSQDTEMEKADLLYKILQGRDQSYFHMITALHSCQQSGAYQILLEGTFNFGLPETYMSAAGQIRKLKDYVDNPCAIQDFAKTLSQTSKTLLPLRLHYAEQILHAQNQDTPILLIKNTIPPQLPYYIPRTLSARLQIRPELFTLKCNDILVFDNISREILTNLASPNPTSVSSKQLDEITRRFILLEDPMDWEELRHVSREPIHLVQFDADCNAYRLCDTSGESTVLQKYLVKMPYHSKSEYSEPEFVENVFGSDYVSGLCICDSPGMGKSILLANLAREIANKFSNFLVAFLPLSKFLDNLPKPLDNLENNFENAINLVLEVLSVSKFAKELLLFLVSLKVIKLILCFDGFDEVNFCDIPWTEEFLQVMSSQYNIVKVFVTARPHLRNRLENVLKVVSYDILPFTEENQVEFVSKYWVYSTPNNESWDFNEFAQSCIRAYKTVLPKGERDILGIPLQCYILANLNVKEAGRNCNPKRKYKIDSTDLPIKLPTSIHSMYRDFINMCFLQPRNNSSVCGDLLRKYHVWKALSLLFPSIATAYAQFVNIEVTLIETEQYNAGILETTWSEENSTSQFLHRSFAEFLVAELFIAIFMHNKNADSSLNVMVAKLLANVVLMPGQKEFQSFIKLAYMNVQMGECTSENIFHRQDFRFPTLAYFANFQSNLYVNSEPSTSSANTFLSCVPDTRLYQILVCCVNRKYRYLIQVVKSVIKCSEINFSSYVEFFKSLVNIDATCGDLDKLSMLLRLAAAISNYETLQECFDLVIECFEDVTTVQNKLSAGLFTPMYSAIRRNEYDFVEFWMQQRIPLDNPMFIYLAIENSYGESAEVVTRKTQIAKLLLSKCKNMLFATQVDLLGEKYDGPLVADKVAISILSMLINLGANIQTTYKRQTIVNRAADYMSTEDFQRICDLVLKYPEGKSLFFQNKNMWPSLVEYITINKNMSVPSKRETFLHLLSLDLVSEMELAKDNDRLFIQLLTQIATEEFLGHLENIGLLRKSTKLRLEEKLKSAKTNPTASNFSSQESDVIEYEEILNTVLSSSVGNFKMFQSMLEKRNEKTKEDEMKSIGLVQLASLNLDPEKVVDLLFLESLGATLEITEDGSNQVKVTFSKHTLQEILTNGLMLNGFIKTVDNTTNTHVLSPLYGRTAEELQRAFNCAVMFNAKNHLNVTIPHYCAVRGNLDALEYCKNLGANMEATNIAGQTPLHLISNLKQNYMETLIWFILHTVEHNKVDHSGSNLVMLATLRGRANKELQFTVKSGINWNLKNKYGQSVLHYAAQVGNIDALEYFTDLGAKLEERDNDGETPLLVISDEKQNFKETLSWFKKQNANLNAVDNYGNNLIFLSVLRGRSKDELQFAEKAGVAWLEKNRAGLTGAHYAAKEGNIEALEYFKSKNANFEAYDIIGETPLLSASNAKENFIETLFWFVKNKANLKAVDNNGNNLILLSTCRGRGKRELEFAVECGIPWNLKNYNGHTGMHYAAQVGNLEALEFFKGLEANLEETDNDGETPLLLISNAKQNFCEMLFWFIKNNANLKAIDNNGNNLLHLATRRGRTKKEIEFAVKCGVAWNVKNCFEQSVVHYAAQLGNLEALEYFKMLGAKLDEPDNEGQTPLLMISNAEKSFTEMLTWFVQNEVNINAVDNKGNNLIIMATFRGRSKEDIEFAVNCGIDWKIKNRFGNSVVQCAAEVGNVDALEYFKSLGANLEEVDVDGETLFLLVSNAKENFIKALAWFENQNLDLNTVDHHGNNLILLAALRGRRKEELELAFKCGVSWNMKNKMGQSGVHFAAQVANLEALEFFKSKEAQLDEPDKQGKTPLLFNSKAKQNFTEVLSWFVEEGVDLNAKDRYGNNLLISSVIKRRSIQELEFAVKCGVSWNMKNNVGQIGLHYATQLGNIEVLEFFKKLGANLEETDNNGETPLLLISNAKQNFAEMLAWFINQNVNVNSMDKFGNNLILLSALRSRHKEDLEFAVKCGVLWNIVNKSGRTAMHLAAKNGSIEALDYFKSLEASIDMIDANGETPLLQVSYAKRNFSEVLSWFAEQNVDLTAVDKNGANLVMLSALRGRGKSELEFVVKSGINWNVKNKVGQSGLHYAAQVGNLGALEFFKELGADLEEADKNGETPLLLSSYAEQNVAEMLTWFSKKSANLHAMDHQGNNLVLLSVFRGSSTKELELIVNYGVNWNVRNMAGCSAMHLAAEAGNVEALEYLKSLGADVEAVDDSGATPLLATSGATQNFLKMLDWFVKEKVNLDAVDNAGNNLVLLAALCGRSKQEINYAVKRGIPWKVKNHFGKSALQLAVLGGNLEALEYFIKKGMSKQCQ